MAVNDKQKTVLINIDAAAKDTIDQKLIEGYVILSVTNLQPSINKLLIIYATPEVI